jgi:alkanesulfonate monooxygenase SsuD/methylene tetrahydromethanopterin reductase-like flavin-dependent oxidoreductase (luciferase family)
MWNLYGETAARMGYQVGPENFGYFQKLIVGDSEEEAYELGKGHIFGGSFTPTRFASLPGYNSKEAVRNYATKFYAAVSPRISSQEDRETQRKALLVHYDKLHQSGHIITGTPKSVIPKLRHVLASLRPSILTIWGPEGPVPHAKTMRMMQLMGEEVLPALRQFGEELNLEDPFQREPGSRPLAAGAQWEPLVKTAAAA